MISQVRLSWTLYNSSLIFQIHRSAIATPGLSPFGRGGYILLSPSHLAVTAPEGIGALSGFPYSRCARIPAPVAASDEALLPVWYGCQLCLLFAAELLWLKTHYFRFRKYVSCPYNQAEIRINSI